ncbi:hypothetical protein AL755_04645 [Arthrobacter sp. ERGS1:01]|nr:hypothetical protein AL755_04645 [Arthrobacter sp. ERGS1:01]
MGVPVEDPNFDQAFRSWEADNPRTMFVADDDGALVGVGGRLLDAAIEFSQDIQAARMVLSPSDESQNFYARHGFVPAEELLVRSFEYKK